MLLLLDLLMRRALGWLGRGSSIRALELENTVLRHEVRLLRRQRRRLDLRRLDRAVLAAASRAIPRDRWSLFLVRPQFYFVLGDEEPDFIRQALVEGSLLAFALVVPAFLVLSLIEDLRSRRGPARH